uniref:Cystatin domain-containing protein n=1 Tax=Pyxicephalus adspersus TaxID=30357 RepID=A0AAV3ATX1_PYXAD|nr:TPA: hypothetical protein GDO54_010509 [Pyxicephalus adspersus]
MKIYKQVVERKLFVYTYQQKENCIYLHLWQSLFWKVGGVCKAIIYIARPWRILKLLTFNCTLGTVPSSDIALRCPDCPVAIRTITPTITEKAKHLVEKFNQDSNQTNHFKVDNIERVSSQWVFGTNYFFHFTTKETDCVKTQKAEKGKAFNLDNCNSLKDHEAVSNIFSIQFSFTTPEKTEDYTVSCEIYDPVDDDHHHSHHHKHGSCDHGKEGAKVEKSKDNVEAGAGKTGADEAAAGEKQVLPVKCELGKGKHCGQHKGLRHHCHPGRHHHHHHHPGHHHHHHHHHDHQNHSHPHDPAHHHHDHHNHTNAEHGSSSEETTDKQPFKRVKGSVQVFYLDEETPSPPVPTIFRLPKPGKDVPETADFPHEPSPLTTCPSSSW